MNKNRSLKTLAYSLSVCTALLGNTLLAGCNMPSGDTAQTPTLDVTQAYQTVEARLTQAAALTPAASPQPSPTQAVASPTPQPRPSATQPKPTNTRPPAVATATRVCDSAAPGNPIDVTIPDDTQMQPGQSFTKTWRLQNVGTCTWDRNYTIAVFSGDAMGAPVAVQLPDAVAPGGSLEISVDLTAPLSAGSYQGNWKLRNASGAWFGIGPDGTAPFWVRIVVSGSAATLTPTVQGAATQTPGTGTPTLTPSVTSPAASVRVSGPASMIPDTGLDLDTNQLNSGGEDISYRTKGNGLHQMEPISGAAFGIFGSSQPTLSNCLNIPLDANPIVIENLTPGTYLCYRTDDDRPGWLQVVSLGTDGMLSLQILTWQIQ